MASMNDTDQKAGPQAAPIVLPLNSVKFIHQNEEIKSQASEKADLERTFNSFAQKWKRETEAYSLTYRRYAHPSYQAILALGMDVVPLILRELQQRPDRWFEALKAFNHNKDEAPNAKTFDETVSCWIKWGIQNNLIPQDDPA
jgi:hypothetical protein